jgi:hypothetical protein
MFTNLHPLQLRSIDPSGIQSSKELDDPYYHPITTIVKCYNSEQSSPIIQMWFNDHNDRMRHVARIIDAESACYFDNGSHQYYRTYESFKLTIIRGKSDLKLDGNYINFYAIDYLNKYNRGRTFVHKDSDSIDFVEYRQLEFRLFLEKSNFDLISQTCASGNPPFVKLDFSSSKIINFNDLDDDCELFEDDVDFNKVLQMSVDIEYAYDHTEKFNPKPKSIWGKIFGG